MKFLKGLLIVLIAFGFVRCGSTDVVSGSVMKRKYRSGLYIAKRGKVNHSKEKLRLLKSRSASLQLVDNTPAVEMSEVAGIQPQLLKRTAALQLERVAKPDWKSVESQRNLYWVEESVDDGPLNNRVLEVILGVLCFLAAIAAFVGLIFGVAELVKVIGGTSSSSMSVAVALAILAFGLPIAIAVVWTLVALGVKLIKGE